MNLPPIKFLFKVPKYTKDAYIGEQDDCIGGWFSKAVAYYDHRNNEIHIILKQWWNRHKDCKNFAQQIIKTIIHEQLHHDIQVLSGLTYDYDTFDDIANQSYNSEEVV